MKQSKTEYEIINRELKAKRLATFLIERLIATMQAPDCEERWIGAALQSREREAPSAETRERVLELLRAARPL